jgi:hypothetical protein
VKNMNWRMTALLVLTSAVLTACGGADSTTDSPSTQVPQQTPPNTAPVISGSPATTAQSGSAYTFQPTATDRDNDTLTFAASGLPAWATFSSQSGRVSGTPSEADVGTTASIVVSVSDGKVSASLPAFVITIASSTPPPVVPVVPPVVVPTNMAPSIAGTPQTTVQASTAFTFLPAASDPESQPLTFSIANKPSWASFSTSTGGLSGTPATTDVRTFSNIVITVSDGSLSTSLQAFAITVTAPPNRAPTITGTAPTSVTANTAYSFTPAGADADGQALAYSISNKPTWATFNTSTGRLSGTPTGANVGTFSGITITASDGALAASLAPFSITVNAAPNVAPTISGTPSGGVVAGSSYSFTPTASDADGNTLGFQITGKPSWATFATATGQLSGTPTTAQAGTYSNIVITVSDGTATQTLPAFTIVVSLPAPTGTAALSWTAPTQNTDGSSLSDLAGYRVYRGTSANALNEVTMLPGVSSTSYTYTQLPSGTHYFAVAAYNVSGVESALSAVGSKTIP